MVFTVKLTCWFHAVFVAKVVWFVIWKVFVCSGSRHRNNSYSSHLLLSLYQNTYVWYLMLPFGFEHVATSIRILVFAIGIRKSQCCNQFLLEWIRECVFVFAQPALNVYSFIIVALSFILSHSVTIRTNKFDNHATSNSWGGVYKPRNACCVARLQTTRHGATDA